MNSIITVENLGKKYLLSHKGREPYTALRDVIANSVRSFSRRLFSSESNSDISLEEEFWALKDVSFEINQGDRIGIIGRNGAGKSTLLKILSRITDPTEGRVRIRGRVASLLEVGTGFHPELTGRENIFLNGAILGMGRAEIAGKFDEIVAFAEVEKFLDTPVKRYSSGMYVRLAFAVAAHLEPEILIVDEVLAVGDAQFQKKCLGKMEEVGKEGRTVLFVSHNMGTISQLCNSGLLLEAGRIDESGTVDSCIRRYLEKTTRNSTDVTIQSKIKEGDKVIIERLLISTESGPVSGVVDNTVPAYLEVTFIVATPGTSYAIAAELSSTTAGVILATSTLDCRPHVELGSFAKRGRYTARLQLPTAWLREGSYSIRVAATIPCVEVLDNFPDEISFTVNDNSSPIAVLGEGRRGVIVPRLPWSILGSP